jgi:hypothetical protein
MCYFMLIGFRPGFSRWRGARVENDGALCEQSKKEMEQRVDALLEGNLLESVEKKRLGGMGQQYLANREHALATDLVLQKITSSGGLKHFKTNQPWAASLWTKSVSTLNLQTCRKRFRRSRKDFRTDRACSIAQQD